MSLRVHALRAVLLSMLLSIVMQGTVSAQSSVWLKVTVPSVYARSRPEWAAARVASLFENQFVAVSGKSSDGAWLRIGVTGVQEDAWVNVSIGEIVGDLATVPVVEPGAAPASPAAGPTSQAAPAALAPATQVTPVPTVSYLSLTISAPSTYARSGPGNGASRVASLFEGETYIANGRNADATWLRIRVPGAGNLWIVSFVAKLSGIAASLPEVSAAEALALAPTPTPQPASTLAPRPVSVPAASGSAGGFELGGQAQGFGPEAVNAMRRAGMGWVKRQVRWSPDDSASSHVGLISEAHARGFKALLSVTGSSLDDATSENFPAFASFAAQLAASGADAIEVWNEQNINREGASLGIIMPPTYANLMNHAFAAIKAANPATLVVSGAPAPTGYFGGCTSAGCDDSLYIAGFVAAGGLAYTDCIGIHYNEGIVSPTRSSGDPRGNPNHYTRYYQTMVDTYYNLAGGQRKLCFTELGYLSGEEWGYLPGGFLWRRPYNLSVAQHAQYLAEAASLSRSQGKVRLMIVFNVDISTFGDDPQAGYAMIRPGGGCPACDSLGAVMGAG